MPFDFGFDPLGDDIMGDEWMLHRVFAKLVFDAFVKMVVRDQYGFQNPLHITLQVDDDEAVLFVWDASGAFIHTDDDLYDWAYELVSSDVFEIDPDNITYVYLDGAVSGEEPYLYIAGDGMMFASGDPVRKGKYLS